MAAKHPLENIGDLAATARAEAARMLAATDNNSGAQVRMPVEQFRKLAGLLAALGNSAGACGGRDCMGAPVDGIRTWVTQDARIAASCARGPSPYETGAAGDLTF